MRSRGVSYYAARFSSTTSLLLPHNEDWFRASLRGNLVHQTPLLIPSYELYKPVLRIDDIKTKNSRNIDNHIVSDQVYDISQCSMWGDCSFELQREWTRNIFPTLFFENAVFCGPRQGDRPWFAVVGGYGAGVHYGPLRLEFMFESSENFRFRKPKFHVTLRPKNGF